VKDIFEIAKKGIHEESQYFDPGAPIHIPIIRDMEGCTAIDVAMGLKKDKKKK